MQMDVLRCKTPEMVEKEIWAHLLAYNLLRTVMAVAAAEDGIEPRRVSFTGAKQAVTAFAPKLEAARPGDRPALIDALLAVIAYHRVGDRPGRWEPRATEAAAEAGGPVEPDTSRGQAAGESLEMVLKLATFVDHTEARKSIGGPAPRKRVLSGRARGSRPPAFGVNGWGIRTGFPSPAAGSRLGEPQRRFPNSLTTVVA